ncbi:SDR family NAD(P)-dependent oxidoreductase [Methylocystis sp. L43]|uniref:SDR family NAD(P)-dependent oxidoreductase n=1 Tax=unclassified Methylocystis TaxID=2625913 RepID=UPI0018C29091|nr:MULTISPECIES: SDR family NAD(P)-dependent oxidoreductase [unclassified Methylocystis]MBG0799417.1 SDR family NAD(P)-dependent oxidoreductase [Methylocystis sp. L43]MBG0807200.1 SDR family NAD(P)-dependent oxidoreductase [Methylocystis sp. H15]
MRAVVVTGASTGIGAACVVLLVENGFLVFASVRKDSDAAALTARHGESVIPLLFDVTDSESIAAAAREVEARLEGETLAGLVNNAGVAVPGPLLHLPIDDFRRQIEVNLIGQLRIIQAFAPLLGAGAQRRGAPGRIVNMSSVAGRFAAPFLGAYATSKFGLEGMSDALRRELMVHGVDVVLVEPGMIATPIWDKAEETDLALFEGTAYAAPGRRMLKWLVEAGRRAPGPEVVARAVLRALTAPRPPLRIPVVRNRFTDYTLRSLLPARFVDRLTARRLGLLPK